MLGRTHLIFGLLLGLFFINFFNLGNVFILFVLLGSLFPDLDHPGSLISRFNFVFKDVSKIISKTIGHRTYLHTLEAGFLFSLLLAPVFSYFGFNVLFSTLGFFVGFIGHLFLDSLTRSGIPLFFNGVKWNLFKFKQKKHYGLKLIKTGSIEEGYLDLILFLLLIGLYLF